MSYLVTVRTGDKYPIEYTQMLRQQARITSGLDLLVFGDSVDGDILIESPYRSWWDKLWLFSPEYEPIRPFLYVDLDSFILGDVSALIQDKPYICREWYKSNPTLNKVQSSIMVIPKDTSEIWDKWMEGPSNWMQAWGDQVFLGQFKWNYIQDDYPNYVGSYKVHSREAPTTRIVTFHGNKKYKPHNLTEGWAKEEWDKWN